MSTKELGVVDKAADSSNFVLGKTLVNTLGREVELLSPTVVAPMLV